MASGPSKSSLMTSIRSPVELERVQEGCGSRRRASDRHQGTKRSAQHGADGALAALPTDRNFKRYFVTTPVETAPSRRAKNSDHRNVRFHANFLSSLDPSSERIGNAVRP